MKNVLLKIYPELNLGDDLFLKAILERYPNTIFYVNMPEDYNFLLHNKYENLKVFSSRFKNGFINRGCFFLLRKISPFLYRKKLIENQKKTHKELFKKCDSFVSIGGSIFMQPKELPFYLDIEYYKLILTYFEKRFIIGANFGPYLTEDFLESYKGIFREFTDVCFRETESYNLFGGTLSNIRYCPDVVLGLDFPMKNEKIKKSVGFSVISNRGLINNKEYISKYNSLIDFYLDLGYKVYLFSFCRNEGDEKMIEAILVNQKRSHLISSVYYDGNVDVFLAIYQSIELMYCSRFHSVILSMKFNQKIFPVIYSKKTLNVLSDLNYNGTTVELSKFNLKSNDSFHSEILSNSYDISNYANEAKLQFMALDSLLIEEK